MNKYTQYLHKNWQLLAALQWLWFERKGLGVFHLKGNRVYFGFYDDIDESMQGLCDRNPPQTHVIIQFEDGFVAAFQPPMSPQECFKVMKPQLGILSFGALKGWRFKGSQHEQCN